LKTPDILPQHCEVLIVGGGIVGAFTAYWLKKTYENNLNVVVIERDMDVREGGVD
jgi:FAD-dependent oxidoreductase domain-containing protein 1